MAVKIGSARIDERGKATGGAAGDQTGREVSTQSWYNSAKGWRVFRAKSPAAAEKIAQDMQWACDNRHIGYDQGQRLTLYNVSRPLGFNCKAVTTDCETDCSALVRVCCAYAGIDLPNFRTPTEAAALLDSGAFVELTGSKYTDSSDYLKRGDILVTRTQGHTVVVLNNGPKAETNVPDADAQTSAGSDAAGVAPLVEALAGIARALKKGMKGDDVKALQKALLALGYSLPKYGADGDFGSETEKAVRAFQKDHGLEADGVYGPLSSAAMAAALAGKAADETPAARFVEITGATVNVRAEPSLSARIIGVVTKGTRLPWSGEIRRSDGRNWYRVDFQLREGWVSEKMAEVCE